MLPLTGTFYAGMPATFTIAGGRRPYRLNSSEPGVFPVPDSINENSFTVIPNNPGVIDSSVQPGDLPVRTVIVSVLDFTNSQQKSTITVAQNFLTGYGVTYTSNCTVGAGGGAAPAACSGGDTTIRVEPTFNGNLIGAKTLRLDVVRGDFRFYNADGTLSGTDGHTITVTTDHQGKTFVLFKVGTGVNTELALYRITDVDTGVSTEEAFTISGTPTAAALTIIPDQFTFTGADAAHCGTGSGRFLAFDGIPPYTATSLSSGVSVDPTTSNTNPGVFEINAGDPNTCLTGAVVVVTDSRLARGTLKVDTKVGAGAVPPGPIRVVPSSVTLTCGQTGSAVIVGGAGGYSAVMSDPNLSALTVTANTISVTRNLDTNTPTANHTSIVTITDGATTTTWAIINPTTC